MLARRSLWPGRGVVATPIAMGLLQTTHSLPTLTPASIHAALIEQLLVGVLIFCAGIFVLVVVLVTYASIRYRARPRSLPPKPTHGNRWLELAWTSLPLLFLLAILSFTLPVMLHVDPLDLGRRKASIVVVGHQWWWEIRYPDDGVITANEIHIPTGRDLVVELQSADVIHDFWVPALARKMDLIPGRNNYLLLRADRADVYFGFCAEFCGAQHAHMRFLVIAEPEDYFRKWLREQSLIPPPPSEGSAAAKGMALFEEKTCASCHAILGTRAAGRVGPNLTHVASRRTLIAASLDNTPENLQRWLEEPQKLKPGSHMPNLRLSARQAQALTAYLGTLR